MTCPNESAADRPESDEVAQITNELRSAQIDTTNPPDPIDDSDPTFELIQKETIETMFAINKFNQMLKRSSVDNLISIQTNFKKRIDLLEEFYIRLRLADGFEYTQRTNPFKDTVHELMSMNNYLNTRVATEIENKRREARQIGGQEQQTPECATS
jgi:hypothetical protein